MSKYGDIFRAARDGTVDDVKYFIEEKGVDVNARSEGDCETALHGAAYYGNVEIVEYLISKGAHVNVKDSTGATPLHFAAADTGQAKHDAGKLEVAKYLVSKGAHINAKEYSNGITPLRLAKAGRTRIEMQKYIKSVSGGIGIIIKVAAIIIGIIILFQFCTKC